MFDIILSSAMAADTPAASTATTGVTTGAAPAATGTTTGTMATTAVPPTAPTPQGAEAGADFGLLRFLPMLLIFLVFYMLLLRPEQRKREQLNQKIKSLEVGDEVITGGGVYGKIISFGENDKATVEIAPSVRVVVNRWAISNVVTEKAPKTADKSLKNAKDNDKKLLKKAANQ